MKNIYKEGGKIVLQKKEQKKISFLLKSREF